MFCGFVDEGVASTVGPFQVIDDNNAPVQPDAAPTYRIYSVAGLVTGGSGNAQAFETGAVTGATNASPIVITSAAHGVTTGQPVTVSSVGGNTAANGDFLATAIDANTFSLQGSTGNGAYTSGGTWQTTGLYKIVLSGGVLSALEAGQTYTVVLTFEVSGQTRTMTLTFTVR